MRRYWIIPFLIVLVGLTGVGLGAEQLDLLKDGSFEQSAQDPALGYWTLEGLGGFVRGDARDGSVAARLIGPQRYTSAWVQEFTEGLEPGREYIVSAWVKAEVDGAVASVGVRWDEAYPRVFRGLRAAEGWQRIEFRFQVPADGVPAGMALVLTGEHEGSLLWDDVRIFEAQSLQERLAAEWMPRLQSGEPVYTGLVVNATGLNVERGMSPRIYDHEGNILFAGAGASSEQLITYGVVAYARTLEDAVVHPRLNVHEAYPLRLPLIVDAVDGRDVPRTGVVLSEADSRRVREALQQYDFFGRFAVVIVVDAG